MLTIRGKNPCSRAYDIATPTWHENGKAILVYGGWNPYEDGGKHDADMIYGDSFVLNTEAWSWITWSIS